MGLSGAQPPATDIAILADPTKTLDKSIMAIDVAPIVIDLTQEGSHNYNGVVSIRMEILSSRTQIEIREIVVDGTSNCATEATDIAPSVLKICKVAGPGVTPKTGFTFATSTSIGIDGSVTVPAGPGPGGYCAIVGGFPIGTVVTAKETSPGGYAVTDISIAMPKDSDQVDLPGKTASIVTVAGVNEITYVNELRTGFIEICKKGDVSGDFIFEIDDVQVTVPAQACSPALQVSSGMHTVVETTTGANIMSCEAYPNVAVACPPGGNSITVEVRPGDIASQTILTVTNAPTVATPSNAKPHKK
ncbi:hypothetical protein [Asticcacaulis sp. AC402]|uniref:hypothetical protein n=1 Tax=Asticcacaulis sp. AC402 TaxID=1282361 RepID=UPI0003C3C806|nr:hypothetical protein [Asticcacaulis sp. AC402]ESQ74592.1 hypothetical protein ABAC402_13185 [Asticcacaulis sp. AC402]